VEQLHERHQQWRKCLKSRWRFPRYIDQGWCVMGLAFPFVELVRWLANVWSLGLVLAAVGTLAWFVYAVFLRRYWRVRRIANIRLKRMLAENAQPEEKR
jgi:hypothetical protein